MEAKAVMVAKLEVDKGYGDHSVTIAVRKATLPNSVRRRTKLRDATIAAVQDIRQRSAVPSRET